MTNSQAEIISIILAAASAATILGIGCFTYMLRANNSADSPYSFSKTQLWFWTLIICPAFSLHWGFCNDVDINATSLILLGITVAVTTTASLVAQVQKTANQNAVAPSPLKAESLISRGFFIDILLDDNEQFSVGRLQSLVFTTLYGTIYVARFFGSAMVYPDFEENAFVLMGISAGAYVIGKSQHK